MKTFATKEKRLAPAVSKARSYVHYPLGPVQPVQQGEIRRILRSSGAQAKLTIGQPNDKYEQEADRVADQVMGMSDADVAQCQPNNEKAEKTIQHKPPADQITPLVQRQEESPEEEEELQAKSKPDVPTVTSSLKGGGQAFTVGWDVVFGAGKYAPETTQGKRLIGHELTHVLQQNGSQLQPALGLQRKIKGPKPKVGPVSGVGGLINDTHRKRMNIVIGPNYTLCKIAKKLLFLWNTATPFNPKGATAPLPVTQLTVDELARGLLVYNRYYLAVPHMTNWKVGLRFPLPIDVDKVTNERTLHPDLVKQWAAAGFDKAWEPLLNQKPLATKTPTAAALTAQVDAFLKTKTSTSSRGIHLSTMALTNADEAAPFIEAVFKKIGTGAFEVALSLLDWTVIHQFDLLASQQAGQQIVQTLSNVLSKPPATITPKQQASLKRSNRLLGRYGVFSAKTATEFKKIYIKYATSCNCMTAVYKGMEALFSKTYSKKLLKKVYREARALQKRTGRDTNSMDRLMNTVRDQGRAGPPVVIKYNHKSKGWNPDPETTMLGMIHSHVPGWYFFGFSIHGAYHSVILVVDRTTMSKLRIYWMDQFTPGFTKDVTGKLPETMKKFKPSYGFAKTQLWQILPRTDNLIDLNLL